MSDHIGIAWNPATQKWTVSAVIRECESLEAAKATAIELTPKIVEALKLVNE